MFANLIQFLSRPCVPSGRAPIVLLAILAGSAVQSIPAQAMIEHEFDVVLDMLPYSPIWTALSSRPSLTKHDIPKRDVIELRLRDLINAMPFL